MNWRPRGFRGRCAREASRVEARKVKVVFGLWIGLSGVGFLPGQATAADRCDQTKPNDPECVIVTGKVSVPENILPSAAAVNGPFGLDGNVLDIPRSLTPVTQKLMQEANVHNMRDLLKVVPDTYAPTDFGAASLPEIRGQLGDIFEDGVRRQGGNNGFGLPLSFNGVAQINVVKGPPPVIFGTTERVGGFIDLIPKVPDLDKAQGYSELSDGSWDRFRGQFDYSMPIEPGRSAVRLSYEQRNEGSFYRFAHYHSQDFYGAYRLVPDARSQLDISAELFHVNFTDIAGINRPTQALIDHGIYITGQGVQPNGSTIPGPFAVISPTGTVQISRSNVLTYPGDVDHDTTYLAHVKYQRTLAPGIRLVDRLYYQHLSRKEISQDSFVEIIKGASSLENRTELIFDYDLRLFGIAIRNQSDTGIDYRYNQVLGYSQFDTEADLPVDLTGPVSNRFIPLTAAQKAQLVQLKPGLYVSPGAGYGGQYMVSDTTDSASHQLGFFIQQKVDLSQHWSVLAAFRGDTYFVTARDPVPPPGYAAARDSITRFLPAGNASLDYKPTEALALYAAWNYSQSTSNSIGGGTALGADGKIDPTNFSTENLLYEVGVKYGPPGGSWYADASMFEQKRALRNRDGSNSTILARGIEAQLSYQPSKRVFAALSGSYLDARYDNSIAFQDTAQVADAFDCSRPDIICGTGIGAPNFTEFLASSKRLQGLPRYQVSGVAGYETTFGLGATLALRYTSSFPLDYLETVVVPNQYTLDTSVYYRYRPTGTELRVDVFNVTDQKNWAPVFDGGYFGATDAFPELPVNVMVTLRQRI
ncbi:MAG: TonB-dependent receptor plug domain-containing protein [Alphaproteobacteria bacterium]|nr:TonB-dependent receptor plug domain-containing protein [Alphaproteobacteria bacterium]